MSPDPRQVVVPVSNGVQFVSLNDLASRWSCSRSTAQRICARKNIPTFYLSGQPRGLIRFRLRDIEALEKEASAL